MIRSNSEDRRELAGQLVEALAQNQLATAFDPIVSLPKGSIVGVEAHVLWNHPTRGQIDRAGFIGLAELIGRVDEGTVLESSRQIAKHLAALRDVGASIVLDGFGLRDASLRALHAHSFDGVKLHQALLDAGSNARALSIVKGMYASAAAAGFDIIHTGVDSDDDLRRLVACLLYTSPSPRDATLSRMPSSA